MPYYAVVPRCPPIAEYVAVVEQACQKLKQGEAEELQGKGKAILKKAETSRSDITRKELKALKELKNDNTRMIFTADNGLSMVVIDRDEYIKKQKNY